MNDAINSAIAQIFSRPLPIRYNGRKDRWKLGKMGLASKLKLLEEFGYKVDVNVTPPEVESPIFQESPPPKMQMRQFQKNRRINKDELP